MAKKANTLEDVAAAFGIPRSRALDLPKPMRLDVSRLGYEDEGLRLTVSIDSPFNYNAEVQLSRADAEWLVLRLREELQNPRNANMPKGKR